MPGTLFVVATPIGNLEDITVRALRILREVAVIAAEDTRRTAHLLARHAIATPTTSLHEHNEAGKSASLVARLRARRSRRARVRRRHADGFGSGRPADSRRPSTPGSASSRSPARAPSWRLWRHPGSRPTRFLSLGFRRLGQKTENCGSHGSKASAERSFSSRLPIGFARRLSSCSAPSGTVQSSIGRELTKVHEELVRGPISAVLARLSDDRGEFTVVALIGQSTDNNADRAPSDDRAGSLKLV